jgi:hypothetical protein
MLALGVASSPRPQAGIAMPDVAAPAISSHAEVPAAVTAIKNPIETGKGWGSMIACAACAVGAGITIAGGPAALLIAVNAPGSAFALMACTAACYEAFQ